MDSSYISQSRVRHHRLEPSWNKEDEGAKGFMEVFSCKGHQADWLELKKDLKVRTEPVRETCTIPYDPNINDRSSSQKNVMIISQAKCQREYTYFYSFIRSSCCCFKT